MDRTKTALRMRSNLSLKNNGATKPSTRRRFLPAYAAHTRFQIVRNAATVWSQNRPNGLYAELALPKALEQLTI
jgi:hypothetical protein